MVLYPAKTRGEFEVIRNLRINGYRRRLLCEHAALDVFDVLPGTINFLARGRDGALIGTARVVTERPFEIEEYVPKSVLGDLCSKTIEVSRLAMSRDLTKPLTRLPELLVQLKRFAIANGFTTCVCAARRGLWTPYQEFGLEPCGDPFFNELRGGQLQRAFKMVDTAEA